MINPVLVVLQYLRAQGVKHSEIDWQLVRETYEEYQSDGVEDLELARQNETDAGLARKPAGGRPGGR